jgi:hypothetical protein
VQNHVVTPLRFRCSRQFTGPATRGLVILVFACAWCFLANAQQERPADQIFLSGRMAENEKASLLAPAQISPQDLPDAPNRLPLQAGRITFGERFQLYRRSITNPDSVLTPAFGAALAQGNNEPPEWGQGASGFGTRLASGYGRMVINRTIRFGVAALDHEDPRFAPSNEKGFWRRFRRSSVDYVLPHTDRGTRIPAFSRFASAYGTAFIANAWYPESRANASHAMMRGSTSLAVSYAWHVFREFWPDIKRAIHRPQEREVREWELDGKDREAPRRPGED